MLTFDYFVVNYVVICFVIYLLLYMVPYKLKLVLNKTATHKKQ